MQCGQSADSDFNSEKESGVVMTSSGFPVGGDRRGVPGEETEGQRWRLLIIPNWIWTKNDDENNGDSLRENEALPELSSGTRKAR